MQNQRRFYHDVQWDIADIRMLLGSDLPIFGSDSHPAISLRLRYRAPLIPRSGKHSREKHFASFELSVKIFSVIFCGLAINLYRRNEQSSANIFPVKFSYNVVLDLNNVCVVILHRDMRRPITVLTGLDYWLDNLMCNVPELAMCFHLDGIVQVST